MLLHYFHHRHTSPSESLRSTPALPSRTLEMNLVSAMQSRATSGAAAEALS